MENPEQPPTTVGNPEAPLTVGNSEQPPTTAENQEQTPARWESATTRLNTYVANTRLGKHFRLAGRNTTFTTEVWAGTATFLTMAHTVAVNASILADSGATCLHSSLPYSACVDRVRRDLVVATAVASFLGSFLIGSVANLPFGVAPAMGTAAYFAYGLVGLEGRGGTLSYEAALGAALLGGTNFLIYAVIIPLHKIIRHVPRTAQAACSAGMGLFLVFVGMNKDDGESPTSSLAVVGFFVTAYCLMKKVKGAMIYGIFLVTTVSCFRRTIFTAFPATETGEAAYRYFRRVVEVPKIESTAWALNLADFRKARFWTAQLTFFSIDMLTTTGTLYPVASLAGLDDTGTGRFEGERGGFLCVAAALAVGSLLGTSPVTVHEGSTVGIGEGGRTGLTAVTVSAYFLLALFFAPLLASVPPWAVGPSMVLCGMMKMRSIKDINWADMGLAIPALLTVIVMALTYSVDHALQMGLAAYVVLHLMDWSFQAREWAVQFWARVLQR